MNKFNYDIVDENGVCYLSVESSFTNLTKDEYAKKFIVPLLSSLAEYHKVDKLLYC
tara:strand:+ start:94 stop:261 length:168 start_codon:yes stop_codon:yes gene_type:complete